MPRFLYKDTKVPYRKEEQDQFEIGDVVIVNENYAHYQGEVQIVLKPIINDGTRNKVGHISVDEQAILPLVRTGEVIIFIEE